MRDPDDLWLKLAWAAATALTLYLIWRGTYPPFIDAANVAYSGEVLHSLWCGKSDYSSWYALQPGAVSHVAFYRAYHLLRYAFAPTVCIKLLSTLAVLALPVAMHWLVRTMQLCPWASLPAFALAFNTNLEMGYLPFVIAIPLLPIALGLIESNARQFRRRRLAWLAVLLVASAWFHYFMTALLLPVVLLWSLCCLKGKPRRWTVAATLAVTMSLVGASVPHKASPPWYQVMKWVPFSERWDQLDRAVISLAAGGSGCSVGVDAFDAAKRS
jgi:hypothetical protein